MSAQQTMASDPLAPTRMLLQGPLHCIEVALAAMNLGVRSGRYRPPDDAAEWEPPLRSKIWSFLIGRSASPAIPAVDELSVELSTSDDIFDDTIHAWLPAGTRRVYVLIADPQLVEPARVMLAARLPSGERVRECRGPDGSVALTAYYYKGAPSYMHDRLRTR